MFPLLLKDGLALPCYATVILFVILSNAFVNWKFKEPEDGNSDNTTEINYDAVIALVRKTEFFVTNLWNTSVAEVVNL